MLTILDSALQISAQHEGNFITIICYQGFYFITLFFLFFIIIVHFLMMKEALMAVDCVA